MQLTPMMQQYMDIKEGYQDCILFFRLGDFYEMFFEDAIVASKEMEVALTGKSCGQEERAPMCGVPFHSVDTYIAKLIEKGYKVAICEQIESPAEAKGIVKREVVQVITPGTVVNQALLNEGENNYLAAVFLDGEKCGIAYCDISTGELYVTEHRGMRSEAFLINELSKISAREILFSNKIDLQVDFYELKKGIAGYVDCIDEEYYNEKDAEQIIKKQFNVEATSGIGITADMGSFCALGALLRYIYENRKHSLKHINTVRVYDSFSHMNLDKATLRNLELTETIYDKQVKGSLLGVLDKTQTAMGARRLKQWLKEPLKDSKLINERLDSVEALVEAPLHLNNIKEYLKEIYDLDRLAGRVACGNANGKDLVALKNSIGLVPAIKSEIEYIENEYLNKLKSKLNSDLSYVAELIENAIVDEPAYGIKDGNIIRSGYSKELDDLKFSIKDGQDWIAKLENQEREATGIKNLKVRFNKVFGYYIEITKSNLDAVPVNYVRKQTLVNCERYITPELKEMESLVLNAEAKINQMEYDIFSSVREEIYDYIGSIQESSEAISVLDVLCSFGTVAMALDYVKPKVDDSQVLSIVNGRHPVVEQNIKDGIFVANDLYIDQKDRSMLLITGPNMAGKSTYMRQNALIVLMAQAGSFVPCESAHIGVVDRIYTRIGASDNLAQGQSTFFVEMSELAYILNTATDRSLVILDEIGRGTSTYDGLSIAWAAVEYLCNGEKAIRTLFATHYHELTVLEEQIKGVKNLNVDVVEENGNIIFLHKIVEGSASRSYGIHVARLAGVPKAVLNIAEEKLNSLETGSGDSLASIRTDSQMEKKVRNHISEVKERGYGAEEEQQLSLFSFVKNPVIERLKNLDLMSLAPWEALKILGELQEAAND